MGTRIEKRWHHSIMFIFLESGGFVLSSGTEGVGVPSGVFRAGV